MVKRFKHLDGKKLIYSSYDRLLQQWGVTVREKDVDTTYGKTHIILAGDDTKPPLLLFHGVGDNSPLMWLYNIQELANHFYVIALDTLGGPGKSEPNSCYYNHKYGDFEQSSWINEVMNTLAIKSTNIAGVSNGAYLAQLYTVKNPDRVKKVICMAGSISVKSKNHHMLRMLKVFLPEALFPTKKNTIRLLRKLCGSNSSVFENNQELLTHYQYLLKYFNNRAMMYHKIASFEPEEVDILREKTLFLIGDCDKLVYHPQAINGLKENNLTYKIIKNAGHGINHEQAKVINSEIINFALRKTIL